jgi:hypothetical protein
MQAFSQPSWLDSHIDAKRLWDYINFKTELDSDEQEHLSSCARCLRLFKLCVLAESRDNIQDDQQKSA